MTGRLRIKESKRSGDIFATRCESVSTPSLDVRELPRVAPEAPRKVEIFGDLKSRHHSGGRRRGEFQRAAEAARLPFANLQQHSDLALAFGTVLEVVGQGQKHTIDGVQVIRQKLSDLALAGVLLMVDDDDRAQNGQRRTQHGRDQIEPSRLVDVELHGERDADRDADRYLNQPPAVMSKLLHLPRLA